MPVNMDTPCGDKRDGRRCWLYQGHRGPHRYRLLRSTHGAVAKVCPRCDVDQDLETAYQWRSDGTVFSWCKGCNRAYAKDRRAARA
jgi:hypothetical protein